MDGVEPRESEDAGHDSPLTVDDLADLQAGLLDDETAARLRKKVRDDPDAQQTIDALNRVRRDVAALGSDASSAPAVAPAVVDGIGAALRAQRPGPGRSRPAHTVRSGRLPRSARIAVAVAGLVAAAAAVWLGTAALIAAPAPTPSRPTTVEHITVSRPPAMIPMSDQQILALLDRRTGLRPTRRTATPRLLPGRLGLSGGRPGAGRPPGRDHRATGDPAAAARRHARHGDGAGGGADLQFSGHRPVG